MQNVAAPLTDCLGMRRMRPRHAGILAREYPCLPANFLKKERYFQ